MKQITVSELMAYLATLDGATILPAYYDLSGEEFFDSFLPRNIGPDDKPAYHVVPVMIPCVS